MSTNLRAGFKERRCKRFHEAIDIVPSLAKRTCLKRVQEKLEREIPPMAMPPPNVVGSSSAPVAEKETGEKEAGSAPNEALGGAAPADEASDKKDTPAPASPPSWDEMMEMLKRVPCFTNAELPSTKMSDLFSFTKRISVNLGGDPPTFVSAQLPFGTLESVVSRIQQL